MSEKKDENRPVLITSFKEAEKTKIGFLLRKNGVNFNFELTQSWKHVDHLLYVAERDFEQAIGLIKEYFNT